MSCPLPKEASIDSIVWLANENAKIQKAKVPPTLKEIFYEVLSLFDLQEDDIICRSQDVEHVTYRQLICYVARQLTAESYKRIGRFLGGYNHATMMTHYKSVAGWIKNDEPFFRATWKYYSINSKLWNQ